MITMQALIREVETMIIGVAAGSAIYAVLRDQICYGVFTLVSHVRFDYPNFSREQTIAVNFNQEFGTKYIAGVNGTQAQLSDMQSIARQQYLLQLNYLKSTNELSQTIADDIQRLQHANARPGTFIKAILQKNLALEENILKTHKAKTDLEIAKMNWRAVSDVAKESKADTLTNNVQTAIQEKEQKIYEVVSDAKDMLVHVAEIFTLYPVRARMGPARNVGASYTVLDEERLHQNKKIAEYKEELARLTDNAQLSRYSDKVLQNENLLKSLENKLTTLYAQQKEEYKQLSEITRAVSEESYVTWGALEPQIQKTNQELLNIALKRAFVWKEMETTKLRLASEQSVHNINIYYQNFLIHTTELVCTTFESKSRQMQGLPAVLPDNSAYTVMSGKVPEVKDLLTLPMTHTESKNTIEDLSTTQVVSDDKKVSDLVAKSYTAAERKQTTAKELEDAFDSMSTANFCYEGSKLTTEPSEEDLEVYKINDVALSSSTEVSTNVSPPSSQVKNAQSKPITEQVVGLHGPK